MNQTFLQIKYLNKSISRHIILALFPHALKLVIAFVSTTLIFILLKGRRQEF